MFGYQSGKGQEKAAPQPAERVEMPRSAVDEQRLMDRTEYVAPEEPGFLDAAAGQVGGLTQPFSDLWGSASESISGAGQHLAGVVGGAAEAVGPALGGGDRSASNELTVSGNGYDESSEVSWADWGPMGLWGSVGEKSKSDQTTWKEPGDKPDVGAPGADEVKASKDASKPQSQRTKENSSSTDWNLLEGKVGINAAEKSKEKNADGSSREASSTESAAVQTGGGLHLSGNFATTTKATDADGNTTEDFRRDTSTKQSLIVSKGELGVGGGAKAYAGTNAVQAGGEVGGQITNKGAKANGSVGMKGGGKDTKGSGSLNTSAGFTSDIESVRDDSDPSAKAYVEHYSVSAGFAAEGSSKPGGIVGYASKAVGNLMEGIGLNVGLGGSADRSGDLAYSQRLDDADYSESGIAADGELSVEERALMLHKGTDRLTAAGAVMGGEGAHEAAASLQEGEAMQLTDQTSGSVEGSFGLGVLGLFAGGGKTYTHTVKTEKTTHPDTGIPMVRLTVGFVDADSQKKGGKLSVGGIDNSLEYASKRSDGRGITVLLDPEGEHYKDVYGYILCASTPEELDSLAADKFIAPHIEGQTWSESAKDTETFTSWIAKVTKTGESSSEVTAKDGELSMKGEASNSTGLSVGSQSLGSSTTKADVEVEGGGLDALITESESGLGLESLWDIRSNLVDLAMSPLEMLEKGPAQALADAVSETRIQVAMTLCLTTNDIELLGQRAGDKLRWEWCCLNSDDKSAWFGLAAELRNPKLDQEFVAINPSDARLLAWGRALLDFGRKAKNASQHLNTARGAMWGVQPDDGVDRGSAGAAGHAGTLVDFGRVPQGMASAAADHWRETTRQSAPVQTILEAMANGEVPTEEEAFDLEAFEGRVVTLRIILNAFPPVDPVVASEMEIKLCDWEELVLVKQMALGTRSDSPLPALRSRERQVAVLCSRVTEGLTALTDLKPGDRSMLSYAGYPVERFWLPYQKLNELDGLWSRCRAELIELYKALGLDEANWKVSPEMTEQDRRDLDPDRRRIQELQGMFSK